MVYTVIKHSILYLMKSLPTALQAHSDLWQASHLSRGQRSTIPTGWDLLDQTLADGGWPRGALTELLLEPIGIGEQSLLLPGMRHLMHEHPQHPCVLIHPPYLPQAAAWSACGIDPRRLLLLMPKTLKDRYWSAEQSCQAGIPWVQLWLPADEHPNPTQLRRLQLAAQKGDSVLCLSRLSRGTLQSSTAALRLLLSTTPQHQLQIHILKQRGGFGGQILTLERTIALPETTDVCHRSWEMRIPAPTPPEQAHSACR